MTVVVLSVCAFLLVLIMGTVHVTRQGEALAAIAGPSRISVGPRVMHDVADNGRAMGQAGLEIVVGSGGDTGADGAGAGQLLPPPVHVRKAGRRLTAVARQKAERPGW